MRLRKITLQGYMVFGEKRELEINPQGMTSLVGGTGSGKTSLMESAPLTIYRQAPTRPGNRVGRRQR